jgi:maltose alpha-D-glucosyltransferase/alpha-amylase
VDNDYVVKIYRKLEAGINPEIEVGRFLTEVAGFANSPALLGSVEFVEGERKSAVAVVHAFIQNQGDAWTVTSAYLDRFVDEQRVLAGDTASESEEQTAYLRYMSQTGRRVAEMHVALASRDDDPAFAPERAIPDDIEHWVSDLVARAARVFDALKQRRDAAKENERLMIEEMLSHAATLQGRLGALFPDVVQILKIRHHGDFHLGQMLIAKDDIFIIDFEGEPRRTLDERRRKAPAARDVAGLIRSIDYSTTAALERALKVTPDDQGKLAAALNTWRDRATEIFLGAYREAVGQARLWPSDPAAAGRLLNFFLLEKAIYEIEYEFAHRPDWLRVPLTGALRILSQQLEAS